MRILAALATLVLTCFGAFAGPVQFAEASHLIECEAITRSSFVNMICFDDGTLVMQLRDTFYVYCRVPAALMDEMKAAESIGRFYNQNVKSDASAGAYACRDNATMKWTQM